MNDGRLWSAKDIAADLRVSKSFAYRLLERGEIPTVNLPALNTKNPLARGPLRVLDADYQEFKRRLKAA